MALGRMGIKRSPEFVSESDSACMSAIKAKYAPTRSFEDILGRTCDQGVR